MELVFSLAVASASCCWSWRICSCCWRDQGEGIVEFDLEAAVGGLQFGDALLGVGLLQFNDAATQGTQVQHARPPGSGSAFPHSPCIWEPYLYSIHSAAPEMFRPVIACVRTDAQDDAEDDQVG